MSILRNPNNNCTHSTRSRRRSGTYASFHFFRTHSPPQSRAKLMMMKLIVRVDFITHTDLHCPPQTLQVTCKLSQNSHFQQHERSLTATWKVFYNNTESAHHSAPTDAKPQPETKTKPNPQTESIDSHSEKNLCADTKVLSASQTLNTA